MNRKCRLPLALLLITWLVAACGALVAHKPDLPSATTSTGTTGDGEDTEGSTMGESTRAVCTP